MAADRRARRLSGWLGVVGGPMHPKAKPRKPESSRARGPASSRRTARTGAGRRPPTNRRRFRAGSRRGDGKWAGAGKESVPARRGFFRVAPFRSRSAFVQPVFWPLSDRGALSYNLSFGPFLIAERFRTTCLLAPFRSRSAFVQPVFWPFSDRGALSSNRVRCWHVCVWRSGCCFVFGSFMCRACVLVA